MAGWGIRDLARRVVKPPLKRADYWSLLYVQHSDETTNSINVVKLNRPLIVRKQENAPPLESVYF